MLPLRNIVMIFGVGHDFLNIFFSTFFNHFVPGIFLVFPDIHTGLFLAKNPNKFLAINNFLGQ